MNIQWNLPILYVYLNFRHAPPRFQEMGKIVDALGKEGEKYREKSLVYDKTKQNSLKNERKRIFDPWTTKNCRKFSLLGLGVGSKIAPPPKSPSDFIPC